MQIWASIHMHLSPVVDNWLPCEFSLLTVVLVGIGPVRIRHFQPLHSAGKGSTHLYFNNERRQQILFKEAENSRLSVVFILKPGVAFLA